MVPPLLTRISVPLSGLWTNFQRCFLGKRAAKLTFEDLTGKVCLVTGSESGLGLATCVMLAERGAHVIMTCLSLQVGEDAAKKVAALEPKYGTQKAIVEVYQLDLSSIKNVSRFLKQLNGRGLNLHLVLCCAGVLLAPAAPRRMSPDGVELHFQVNCLSQWFLVYELLKEQERRRQNAHAKPEKEEETGERDADATDPLRVVVVSSAGLYHCDGSVFDDLLDEKRFYTSFDYYARSKLGILLLVKELQRQFDRDVVAAVHPGDLNTPLAVEYGLLTIPPFFRAFFRALAPLLLVDPEYGAWNNLYVAAAPAEEVRGRMYYNCAPMKAHPPAEDAEAAASLWDTCCKLAQASSCSSSGATGKELTELS